MKFFESIFSICINLLAPQTQILKERQTMLHKRLTAGMINSTLSTTFTKEEVKVALKQMAHSKSLGPDRFNPYLQQTYWYIVRDEVTYVVFKFLNDGCFDSGMKFTYVVLILKKTFDLLVCVR